MIPRAHGSNIVDSRWVLRWKPDPTAEGGRVVKARLCVRGYKDLQQSSLETYASIATRWGQRLICSVCVQNNWQFRCYDVKQVFLQGLAFDELVSKTGEPVRKVCYSTH